MESALSVSQYMKTTLFSALWLYIISRRVWVYLDSCSVAQVIVISQFNTS